MCLCGSKKIKIKLCVYVSMWFKKNKKKMKQNKIKYMIAAAALILAAAIQTGEVKAQWAVAQNTTNNESLEKSLIPLDNSGERAPFAETLPPSYAPPGTGGNSQKEQEDDAPVVGGFMILTGLVMAYGISRRKRRDLILKK